MSMAENNIPNTSPSKRAGPRLSIRARLMVLALLAVVPLTLDRVRLLENSRTERTEMAASEAIDLAKRGAGAQLEMINSTRAVLEVVARAYITLARSGQDCSTFLAGFVIDVSGRTTASSARPGTTRSGSTSRIAPTSRTPAGAGAS
jgi:hypothetical protein